MEHYKFKVTLTRREPGGYFIIKRKLRNEMVNMGTNLSVDYRQSQNYLVFELSSERPEQDIVARLKKEIGDTTRSWKVDSYKIEKIVEKKPAQNQPNMSSLEALSGTISQLSGQITNYEKNEETLVTELVALEGRVAEQDKTIAGLQETNKKLETRVAQYSKDEKKYKDHDALVKENMQLKTGILRLGKSVARTIDTIMHETKSLHMTVYDHIKDAIKQGFETKPQIVQYFQDHKIDATDSTITTALSVGKKKKMLWTTEGRGHYKLL